MLLTDIYPPELATPPSPLVALVGQQQLHVKIGHYLKTQNLPRLNAIGIADAHSAAGTIGESVIQRNCLQRDAGMPTGPGRGGVGAGVTAVPSPPPGDGSLVWDPAEEWSLRSSLSAAAGPFFVCAGSKKAAPSNGPPVGILKVGTQTACPTIAAPPC